LIDIGFRTTKQAHRLTKGDIYPIDIVPFGAIAENNMIEWPPHFDTKMNVVDFQEALEHALEFSLSYDPVLTIKVASPAGLSLMKLIAWTQCAPELRSKDASDFKYIIESMERLPNMTDRLYDLKLLEKYDANQLLISALLLGEDVARILSHSSSSVINEFSNDQKHLDYFSQKMGKNASVNEEANYHLLDAVLWS